MYAWCAASIDISIGRSRKSAQRCRPQGRRNAQCHARCQPELDARLSRARCAGRHRPTVDGTRRTSLRQPERWRLHRHTRGDAGTGRWHRRPDRGRELVAAGDAHTAAVCDSDGGHYLGQRAAPGSLLRYQCFASARLRLAGVPLGPWVEGCVGFDHAELSDDPSPQPDALWRLHRAAR
uniref:Uncharacterized protein n=1 Tax=Hyaloperonospora arabidopsidis (strain Emoy2) TaxID=559515 RepID=M4C5Z7_HYAAE